MFYPVTLTRDDNGSYLVTFPGVPEAVTYGDTVEAALEHALEALLSVIDAKIRDRGDIPAPGADTGKRLGVTLPALEASKVALYQTMRTQKVTKAELGRRLHVHMPQVDRILNVRHASQFGQVETALRAMGKRLVVQVEDVPPVHGGVLLTVATAKRSGVKRVAAATARMKRRTLKRRAAAKR